MVVCDIGTGSHYDMHLSYQYGDTALMRASEREHMECVRVLLDRGAEVNMQDKVSAAQYLLHDMLTLMKWAQRGCVYLVDQTSLVMCSPNVNSYGFRNGDG